VEFPEFLGNKVVHERSPLENENDGITTWNTGIMGSRIGITLIEVGGASACSGLEAEGQQSFASCIKPFVPQDKLIAPEPKVMLFRL